MEKVKKILYKQNRRSVKSIKTWKEIKKKLLELERTAVEMKNSVEGFKGRRLSEVENSTKEIIRIERWRSPGRWTEDKEPMGLA